MILAAAVLKMKQEMGIVSLKKFIEGQYPITIRAIRALDLDLTRPKRGKGYNLVKRDNKRLGFVYYARYYHEGKMLPTKWSSKTNVLKEAERFAVINRERLIGEYLSRKNSRMFEILVTFYTGKVPDLTARSTNTYRAIVLYSFIPFLKEEKITYFEQITQTVLHRYQDSLLCEGKSADSVNNKMYAVKKVFASLARKGVISENPAAFVKRITMRGKDRKPRGCHELEKVDGVFSKKWGNELSRLLALVINTTGIRNGEIGRIKLQDIQAIDGCRFVSAHESKTENGIRLVPIHDRVYREIEKCLGVLGTTTPLSSTFKGRGKVFDYANIDLACQLGVSEAELRRERITFYSGRHFWKTLMNSEGLGEDIEEIFMGHKVTGNVAKLYNHRDKRGRCFRYLTAVCSRAGKLFTPFLFSPRPVTVPHGVQRQRGVSIFTFQ